MSPATRHTGHGKLTMPRFRRYDYGCGQLGTFGFFGEQEKTLGDSELTHPDDPVPKLLWTPREGRQYGYRVWYLHCGPSGLILPCVGSARHDRAPQDNVCRQHYLGPGRVHWRFLPEHGHVACWSLPRGSRLLDGGTGCQVVHV